MTENKLLVVIPAYNEEGNIHKTLEELFSFGLNSKDILVVDDGSKDLTKKISKDDGVNVVSFPYNIGIGAAVQVGFKFAYRNDYDIVIRVDGDGQHDPKYINDLINTLNKENLDLVIGSRFVPPNVGYQSSFIRKIGINFFSQLLSSITGYKITDPTSGFRAYNKKMIKIFSNYYPVDFPEPEEIIVVKRYKKKLKEIPVEMRKRLTGHSSIRYLKTLYYMIKVTFAILIAQVKQKKEIL